MPSRVQAESRARHFAQLCNRKGLVRAVEIGVGCGIHACQFLEAWDGEMFFGVDPWESYPDAFPTMAYDRTPDLLMAAVQVAPHAHKARLVRCTSEQAAAHPWFQTHRPQFVFIDGDHSYTGAARDLALWWPLVESRGFLAGHDYTDEAVGVQQAVDEFAAREGVELTLVDAPGDATSWWVRKP